MDVRHYTIFEDVVLAIGVLRYGSGSWAKICDDPTLPIYRSNVSLKDQWRVLRDTGRMFEILRDAEKFEEKVDNLLR